MYLVLKEIDTKRIPNMDTTSKLIQMSNGKKMNTKI